MLSSIQCVAVVRPKGVLEMQSEPPLHEALHAVFPMVYLVVLCDVCVPFLYTFNTVFVERPESFRRHVLHCCSFSTTVLYLQTASNSK